MAVIDYGTAGNGWNARTFKPGDILDASFHYSMKIPYFYIVTRTSKSSIWARKLGRMVVSHDGYGQNGYMMPNLAERGEEEMGRIGKGGYVKLGGCTAHIWSGKPVDFYSD